jgi:succinate dehydrogenase flavin-adding protein (antitoxin of CptAB toxin-antitoxin module)
MNTIGRDLPFRHEITSLWRRRPTPDTGMREYSNLVGRFIKNLSVFSNTKTAKKYSRLTVHLEPSLLGLISINGRSPNKDSAAFTHGNS